MARLDSFEESKRGEIIRNLKNDSLLDFFYQYSLKMYDGERYTPDESIQIMDTWGEVRTEILKRMDAVETRHSEYK